MKDINLYSDSNVFSLFPHSTESIVKLGFSVCSTVHQEYMELVMSQSFYPDFVATLSKYCHCEKFPKIK